MAIIFGGKSGYLGKKRYFLFLTIVVLIFAVLGLAGIFPIFSSYGLWALAGALCFVLLLEKILKMVEKEYNRFDNGIFGEEQIIRELKKLPDEYAVFRGIMVGSHQDIDCAVIGPTGIFVVEVKSHRGKIGFNGVELTRNGQRLEKDFFHETMAEAVGLRDLIRNLAKEDVFVEPVIIFSRATVALGPQKLKNCYVIGRGWLNELLVAGRGYTIDSGLVLKISSALAALIHDKRKEEKIKQLEKTPSLTL